MPRRTDDVQRLVGLIQSLLGELGAQVSEYALEGESAREIDVLVKSPGGGKPHIIKITVECSGEKRKMDLDRFDALVGKSQNSKSVNKLVLISKPGFTKEVQKRARERNLQLWTLKEALRADWKAACCASAPVPMATEEFTRALEAALAGLDVVREFDKTIHDPARATDIAVDVLVRTNIGSSFKTKTAIVFEDTAAATDSLAIRHWQAICRAAGLDRVVLVNLNGFSAGALRLAGQSAAVRLCATATPTEEEIIEMLFPPIFVLSAKIERMSVEILSAEARRFIPSVESVLRLGADEFALRELLVVLVRRIRGAAMEQIVEIGKPTATSAECELEYECPLPGQLEIIEEGASQCVCGVRGNATILGKLAVLTKIRKIRDEQGGRLSFADGGEEGVQLLAAGLVRRGEVSLVGGQVVEPGRKIKVRIPEERLANIIAGVAESAVFSESEVPYPGNEKFKLVTVDTSDTGWAIQIAALDSLARMIQDKSSIELSAAGKGVLL